MTEPLIETEDYPTLRAIQRLLLKTATQRGDTKVMENIADAWDASGYTPPEELIDELWEILGGRDGGAEGGA